MGDGNRPRSDASWGARTDTEGENTMSHTARATCVVTGDRPLNAPEATVVVVVLVLAVLLALAGMPALSVLVLLAETTDSGLRLVRRARSAKRVEAAS